MQLRYRFLRCMWCHCRSRRPTDKGSASCSLPKCNCVNIIPKPKHPQSNPATDPAWKRVTWDGAFDRPGRQRRFFRWRWDTKARGIWWSFGCDRSINIPWEMSTVHYFVTNNIESNKLLRISIQIPELGSIPIRPLAGVRRRRCRHTPRRGSRRCARLR